MILPLKSLPTFNDLTSTGPSMPINRKLFSFLCGLQNSVHFLTWKTAMASSKPTSSSQVPRVHHFELVEGTQLQVVITIYAHEFLSYLDTFWNFFTKSYCLVLCRLMWSDLQVDAMLELNFNLGTVQQLGYSTGVVFTVEIRKGELDTVLTYKYTHTLHLESIFRFLFSP